MMRMCGINEHKKDIIRFCLFWIMFAIGFCCGYNYDRAPVGQIESGLYSVETEQRETGTAIQEARESNRDAQETTERISDTVRESESIERSSAEAIKDIGNLIEEVEKQNHIR